MPEYGTDALEIHRDAIVPGQRYCSSMICWPPGTFSAAVQLIRQLGGIVVGGFSRRVGLVRRAKAPGRHRCFLLVVYDD